MIFTILGRNAILEAALANVKVKQQQIEGKYTFANVDI